VPAGNHDRPRRIDYGVAGGLLGRWSAITNHALGAPERLIAALAEIGVDARDGQVFDATPFAADGYVLCLGTEQVRMFVFYSIGDRVDAAARIDPSDPSNVGTAMVSWNGRPRFWQRDRLLILYLGEVAATETVLNIVLGEPFASGEGRPLLRDDRCH
jgi:hypothetical protein